MLNIIYAAVIVEVVCLVAASNDIDSVEVTVTRQSGKVLSYDGVMAEFGARVPSEGLGGQVHVAELHSACQPVTVMCPVYTRCFLLVADDRNCSFDQKVLNAQLAGYSAAIVYSLTSERLVVMKASSEAKNVSIPSVYVGYKAGYFFIHYYSPLKDRVYLYYNVGENNAALIAVIVICVVLFVVFIGVLISAVVILRPCRAGEEQLLRRRRRANLKKIPVTKFKTGDVYDICAICLEDYKVGDKLRILHCSHVYHCKCIDTWLVQDSDLCPLCKKSVIDDDMEEEAATASQSATAPTTSVNNAPGDDESEDAPLLRGASRHRRQRYGSRLPAAAHHQRYTDDDNDSGAEGGTRPLFSHRAAVHRHPRHTPTTYGSAARTTVDLSAAVTQPSDNREPSADVGEPSSDVHVTGRRHRGRRGHTAQTQPSVEDVSSRLDV